MIKCMISDFMPAGDFAADYIGIFFRIAADYEKSHFYIVFFEQIEYRGRFFVMRTVVKSERYFFASVFAG